MLQERRGNFMRKHPYGVNISSRPSSQRSSLNISKENKQCATHLHTHTPTLTHM